MPFRAIANGNVLDAVPASLVGVLYVEISEAEASQVRASPPPTRYQARKPRAPRKRPAAKADE